MTMRFSLLHLFLLAAAALLSSCLNTPEVEEPVEQTEILSLSEDEVVAAARAHYERYKQTTRIVCGDGEKPMWIWQAKPHAPYDLGEYEIDWLSAYTKYEKYGNNPIRIHTDFDIIKENDFIYFPDSSDYYSGMKLRSRFVSVQTPDTIIQYIATYIPHPAYYDRYYTVRHGGGRIGLREVNFSGKVLCTTLDGYHYAVYRVWQGEITAESNLYANFPPRDWLYERFFTIMQDTHIGVCRLGEMVENAGDLTEDEIARIVLIEEIVINGSVTRPRIVNSGTVYKYTPDLSTMNEYVKFYRHIGGGGGGSSNNDNEDGGDTSAGGIDGKTPEEVSEDIFNNYGNLADSVKTKLNTMIAEIAEDCMGKELLSQLMEESVAVGLSFSNEGNSKFYHDSNGVVMVNNHSEGLMHELFHAYQYNVSCQGNVATYSGLIKNFEAEAHIAAYFYMDRCLDLEMYSRQKKYSRRNVVGIDASKAADCLTYQGYINEWDVKVENQFRRYFRNAALSAGKKNSNPFNENRSIDENVEVLRILSQNCTDF